jgi:hypothetical protein
MENQTIQGRNFLMQNGQHGLSRCSREPWFGMEDLETPKHANLCLLRWPNTRTWNIQHRQCKTNAFKTQPLKHLPLAPHEWVENLVIHKAIDCTWANSSIVKIVNYEKKAAKKTEEWCDLQSPSFLSKKTIYGITKALRNSKKTDLSTMN